MDLDRNELEAACREVAAQTLWQTSDPRDITDIIDRKQIDSAVSRYLKEALDQAQLVDEQQGDPNLVSRAVRYLAHEHAIPPMKDDVLWFRHGLEILIRLVHPISGPTESSAAVMDDLRDGIQRYLADLSDPRDT